MAPSYRHPRSRPDRSGGFTLLEVVIATGVIALVVIGVVSTFTTAFMADRSSREVVNARNFGQEVMETLEAVPFDGLLGMNGSNVPGGDLSADVAVTEISAGLLRVEVTVSHTSIADATTRLVTLVADRD